MQLFEQSSLFFRLHCKQVAGAALGTYSVLSLSLFFNSILSAHSQLTHYNIQLCNKNLII